MTWDNTRPDGTKKLNQIDDDLRENNAALEAAIDLEHSFTTGADQSGRHTFGVGATATRDAFHPIPVTGNVWLNTKDYATRGWIVLQVYDGGVPGWVDIDLYDANQAWVNEAKDWTAGQASSYVTMAKTPNTPPTPDVLDWNVDDGNFHKTEITNDTLINAPTGALKAVDNGAHFTLELTNDTGAPYTVTYHADLLPAQGVQLGISPNALGITQIHLTMTSAQKFVYSVVRVS